MPFLFLLSVLSARVKTMTDFSSVWDSLRQSTPQELQDLKRKAYEDTKKLFVVAPDKANKAIEELKRIMNIRKIVYDMYVWQRIEAVEQGIDKAMKMTT